MKRASRMTGRILKIVGHYRWWLARKVTAGGFLVLLVLGTFAWFPWLRGSTTGTTVLGLIPFTDPLAMVEVLLASRVFTWEYVFGGFLLIILALIMGPLYCGWLCPLGLVLEVNQALLNGWLRLVGRRHGYGHEPVLRVGRLTARWPKYVLLGAAVGFAFSARVPIFQIVSPINILVRGILFAATPWLFLLLILVLLEWIWPRLWCRSFCPLGGLYALLGRCGMLRIRIDPALAGKTPCGQCTRACPLGIEVLAEYVNTGASAIDHADCTRCGDCIGSCPRHVLRLGFRDFVLASESVAPGEVARTSSISAGLKQKVNGVTLTVAEETIGQGANSTEASVHGGTKRG